MKRFENQTKNIILEISDDDLSAYLTIKKTGSIIDEQDIAMLIAQGRIKAGIAEAKAFMHEAQLEKDYNKPFPIALGEKGTEPQAEFSALFDTDNCYTEKDFIENNSLLNKLVKVEKDATLAHLFITRPGRSGFNVYSEPVLPKYTEEELLISYLGENVYYSKDRSQIYAKTAGYPYLDENKKVCVKSAFIIDGDLNKPNQEIRINGDLIINGHVKPHTKLEVLGKLEIKGNVEDSEIYAKGKITIKGKVVNCRKRGISSETEIHLESAENSLVLSGGNIYLEDKAKFCRFIAENEINGSALNSAFEGGHCQASNKIMLAFLGNSAGIATEAELTVSPYKKEEILIINKRLKSTNELDENKKVLLEEKAELLSRQLERELTYNLLEGNNENKSIGAYQSICSGVYLRILKNSLTIEEDVKKAKYMYTTQGLKLENN